MATTITKHSRKLPRNPINVILVIILIIETIFLAGVIGYRLGERSVEVQPIYNITLQVDPSMIEHVEPEENAESDIFEESESAVEPGVQIEEPVEVEPEIQKTSIAPSYTEEEIEYLAKTVYGEAGHCNKTQQSAVVWCVLNRVESSLGEMPDDIISNVIKSGQFVAYKPTNPVLPEHYDIAKDVLDRWDREKAGETNVGRTLAKDYLWFGADGTGHGNRFRNAYRGGTIWDWSLGNPYGE